jgi:hypothetical protein
MIIWFALSMLLKRISQLGGLVCRTVGVLIAAKLAQLSGKHRMQRTLLVGQVQMLVLGTELRVYNPLAGSGPRHFSRDLQALRDLLGGPHNRRQIMRSGIEFRGKPAWANDSTRRTAAPQSTYRYYVMRDVVVCIVYFGELLEILCRLVRVPELLA